MDLYRFIQNPLTDSLGVHWLLVMAAKSTLSKPKLDAARKQANGNPIKLHPIKQLAIVKNAKATVHFSEPAKTTWGRRINLILRPFFNSHSCLQHKKGLRFF